jgi:hypothetical protein
MSGDKRKHGPLNTFVTVTKKPLITPSSSEQTEHDQSEIVSLEVVQQIGTKSEEPENNDSSVNQSELQIWSLPIANFERITACNCVLAFLEHRQSTQYG